MQMVVCIAYFAVLLVLAMYGLHRSHLVFTVLRHRKTTFKTPAIAESDFPHVTVQLPLFNEVTVATRLLDYVAALDYPRDRLEIQVLDDSTDETVSIVRAHVALLQDQQPDLEITYIHRTDRTGYKAGALDNGLKVAKGEIVAIFDADFLPQPEFLRAL